MEAQCLFAGFGGQGVLLMGRLLAQAAMDKGFQVSWMPSYGPEMRGGEANCAVVISDDPIGSPLISEATVAVIMNKPSLVKFMPKMQKGSVLFYNSSLISDVVIRDDIKAYAIPCNSIAGDIGNDRVANMVMMGAVVEGTDLVSQDELLQVLADEFGESKKHLLPINKKAMNAGAELIK